MKLLANLTINPAKRMVQHIDYLDAHITIKNKFDKTNFDTIHRAFMKTGELVSVWRIIRGIVFFVLYVSVIGALATGISAFFADLLAPVYFIANLAGAGILTLALLLCNKMIEVYTSDMSAEHSHLVALLVKANNHFQVHQHYQFGLFKTYEKK